MISYLRGPNLFVFNFHPVNAYERYTIGVEEAGEYQVSVIYPFFLIFCLNQNFEVFVQHLLFLVAKFMRAYFSRA